jgi:hypothetical protein
MNWRRGLLLAGVNLLAAVPLICLLAAREAQYLKESEQEPAREEALVIDSSGEISRASAKIVQAQEEQTVSFDPCSLVPHYPPQASVLQAGNLPVVALSQWRIECPARWSVAHILGVSAAGLMSPANLRATRRVDIALCLNDRNSMVPDRRFSAHPAAAMVGRTRRFYYRY